MMKQEQIQLVQMGALIRRLDLRTVVETGNAVQSSFLFTLGQKMDSVGEPSPDSTYTFDSLAARLLSSRSSPDVEVLVGVVDVEIVDEIFSAIDENLKCIIVSIDSMQDILGRTNVSYSRFYGFRFNADFFACAADRRWWHDHRFPGGIAFTANSTGHMIRFREWYQRKDQSEAWALKQAMLTIQNAAPTKGTEGTEPTEGGDPIAKGCVTWLLPLDAQNKPLLGEIPCPLTSVPKQLENKDWTRYEGLLHTDHAVREEFFLDRDVAPTTSKPYLMDFTYLYDDNQVDFEKFTRGKPFTDEEVYADIGRPGDWTHRARTTSVSRSEEEAAKVLEQLSACNRWQTPSWHVVDPEEKT